MYEVGTLVKENFGVLEEYDNGGTGDYTIEKNEQPEWSIDDILK